MVNSTGTHARNTTARPQPETYGLPVWAPLCIMLAVVITGALLPTHADQLTPPAYFWLYSLAAIICTFLVTPTGLALTVLTQPLFYFIGTLLANYFGHTTNDLLGGAKTALAKAAIPIVNHFPFFIITFLLCIALAVYRWYKFRTELVRSAQDKTSRQTQREQSEIQNLDLNYKARALATSVMENLTNRRKAKESLPETHSTTATPQQSTNTATGTRPAPVAPPARSASDSTPTAQGAPRTNSRAQQHPVQGSATQGTAAQHPWSQRVRTQGTIQPQPAQRRRTGSQATSQQRSESAFRQQRVQVDPMFQRNAHKPQPTGSSVKAESAQVRRHRRAANNLDENLAPTRRRVSDFTQETTPRTRRGKPDKS